MYRGENFSMNSYNLAVIIAGIDEGYQNAILNGIESFTADNNINTAVFVSFSGVMGNQRHDAGEFNIFNLPDFKMFDGAILLTNTIAYQPVVNSILSRIKSAGIPAVSIDNDIPEFYHIGIDNGKAMREITEHFIKAHGCVSFNYVSGPRDNPESKARLDSFLAVLSENGLSIESERIFYGDFRSPSGRDAVAHMLESDLPLPQALICANDVMAVSAMIALKSAGIRVPEDIIVSGFDNTYNDHRYPIELTSVERPLKRSGELACSMLLNHFRGIKQERSLILDMHPHFAESCGCVSPNDNHNDINELKRINYSNYVRSERSSEYLALINRMSCQLVECDSLSDFTASLRPFISEIGTEEFYLCICDNWNIREDVISGDISSPAPADYTEKIFVPLAFRNKEFCQLPDFSSSEILPGMFSSSEKNKFYYFIPLHFRERCLGYMIFVNSRFPLESSMFQTWCINISNMLENVRKIICLDYAVKKLDNLYTIDTLSGISNRNGFAKGASALFKACIQNKRPVMLMFLDMDDLKHINDNFGHNSGDDAIHEIANVIRDSCTNGEVFCRFGGDEFIIFGSDYTESDAQTLTKQIHENMDKSNKMRNTPYTLSVSTGYYITYPNADDDIFDLVTVADNVMYNEKKKKKLSKYKKN